MSFEEFVKKIRTEILTDWMEDASVKISQLKKNNNQTVTGLHIDTPGSNISPIIYLESYYEMIERGQDFFFVLNRIRCDYERACLMMPKGIMNLSNFSYIKERIIYRLIHYEKNKEILKDCPHIRLFDLALTFRWVAYTDETGLASALITNQEMEYWEVTKEELLLMASENTPKLFPPKIYTMDQILKDFGIIGEDSDVDIEMFILTNKAKINGATVLFYENTLADFAQSHQSDFYVLPSSVHEVILLPVAEVDSEEVLFQIVREANEKVVALGDVLSDSVYYYHWKEKRMEALFYPEEKI